MELVKCAHLSTLHGIVFELLSAFITTCSGVFIGQWPDAEQAGFAFKVAFAISMLQLAVYGTYLSGDWPLPPHSWPLGTFFFSASWGLDRYMLYSLNKTLKLISEFGTAIEDMKKRQGNKEGDACAPKSKKDQKSENLRRRGSKKKDKNDKHASSVENANQKDSNKKSR
eukprot:CAMPEP_0184497260 /NCGR_PEP_ID=MMETSP0113_2-20130426/36051_1 /TAXON_ID=91329 /ORGANISM="Norrisiella sphaerica, Strain BC52" /LENGTH=168 /DNA_ID=CAMNT_0026884279 /DNA_START=149 /DNA_END=655 /DNA_ORIENTATION=-